ncbi:tRNA (N6-threonylcarbamoyladenosine(37)-N6)-methyltransferase TrmO [Desulfuromonas carbonis]|uniref:tRNA (N6-threonylcarbamoyladenosine(37)-N6)-methyltransferase TrmO n=1 Tax=Desulfuromonas sp. DDH964 TaxID=1823759 RepID=UPI00078D14B0|nr:tRNA (N6-threonylcarbamoyladenosine(37)-N6)-methyltransferase TrmO [Desulfuromonas sp. DDH964]AMV72438.1 SAM-binding protein [Desulfuromonas sp. DDH964]
MPPAAEMQLRSVGHIETPWRRLEDCPRNIEPDGPVCRLVLAPEYAPALCGLQPGQTILVLYWLDRADRLRLHQASRITGEEGGVFALRTPNRPNPIGAGVVRIERCSGNSIEVRGLDCLDGTALLDIKPAAKVEQPPSPGKKGSR